MLTHYLFKILEEVTSALYVLKLLGSTFILIQFKILFNTAVKYLLKRDTFNVLMRHLNAKSHFHVRYTFVP